MKIETVLSMLLTFGLPPQESALSRTNFRARLAFTVAAFNLRVQWNGLKPDAKGVVHFSIANFSL